MGFSAPIRARRLRLARKTSQMLIKEKLSERAVVKRMGSDLSVSQGRRMNTRT